MIRVHQQRVLPLMRRALSLFQLSGHCLLCQRDDANPNTSICRDCFEDLPWLYNPCMRCGLPDRSGRERSVCSKCQLSPPQFDAIIPALQYAFPVSQLIYQFKSRGNLHAGRAMGDWLSHMVKHRDTAFDLLLPVPMHPLKRWQRGFNQAELLAQDLSRTLNLPTSQRILKQVRQTRAVKELTARGRVESVRDAFRITRSLAKRRVALVDDVVTSMATANEATRALKAAGAHSVTVLCVARTLNEGQSQDFGQAVTPRSSREV